MKFVQVYFFISCGISFVISFSWENCGTRGDTFKVLSLDAYSNQTKTLFVTAEGKVARNVTSPIQAKIEMQKKFFWGWTQIPCVEDMGSCTYTDVCQLSPYIHRPCPSEFTSNDLPCKCPILEGRYQAKRFPIDLAILPNWIEEGKYRIKFTLSQNNVQLICLRIYIQF